MSRPQDAGSPGNSNDPSYHPILRQLALVVPSTSSTTTKTSAAELAAQCQQPTTATSSSSASTRTTTVSALDILQYLLQNSLVSPSVVEQAWHQIQDAQQQRQTEPSAADPISLAALTSTTSQMAIATAANTTVQQSTTTTSLGIGTSTSFKPPAASAATTTLISSSSNNNNNNIQPDPATQADPAATSSSSSSPTVRTRHVALEVFYNGENYTGLAENVGKPDDQSIERALFAALERTRLIAMPTDTGIGGSHRGSSKMDNGATPPRSVLPREVCRYSRCGRTDRGVSAAGQVLALELKSAFPQEASWDEQGKNLVQEDQLPKNSFQSLAVYVPPRRKNNKKGNKNNNNSSTSDKTPSRVLRSRQREHAYDKILNNLLPPEIRVLGWTPVSPEFSARFSATTRTYRYFFVARPHTYDLASMREALPLLVGEHDFRNLCKMDVEKVYNFTRQIHSAGLHEFGSNHQEVESSDGVVGMVNESRIFYFEILGQAFLWHQIRCIVSLLFMIGQGLEEPSIVSDLLNLQKYPGKPAYPMADERHLVLHHCGYPSLDREMRGYSAQNLWQLQSRWEQQLEDLLLSATRIRNGIESIQMARVLVDDVAEFCHVKLVDRQRKARKYASTSSNKLPCDPEKAHQHPFRESGEQYVLWETALKWMKKQLGLIPDPSSQAKEQVHIPLAHRSKGTTYEEKVASLQQSSKRRSRYEENVIKKRRTEEEDQAFYDHMTKQGGSAV